MAFVGYARVSSVGQSLAVQLDKLHHSDKIFQEHASSAGGRRPRLEACLEYVREGDTLVVTRLDRLARSTLHLCQIAAELQRKQVSLQVLDQHLDTSDATGRLLFESMEMLGIIDELQSCHAGHDRSHLKSRIMSSPMRISRRGNAFMHCYLA